MNSGETGTLRGSAARILPGMEWTTLAELQPSLRRSGAIAAVSSAVGAVCTCLLNPAVPAWAVVAWAPAAMVGLELRATMARPASAVIAWRVAYLLAAVPAWIGTAIAHHGAGSPTTAWLLGGILCAAYVAGSRALAR